MPMVSQKQRNLMHAVALGKAILKGGPTKAVAQKFVAHDQGGKLPLRAPKKDRKV